jgi:hypothetical protein
VLVAADEDDWMTAQCVLEVAYAVDFPRGVAPSEGRYTMPAETGPCYDAHGVARPPNPEVEVTYGVAPAAPALPDRETLAREACAVFGHTEGCRRAYDEADEAIADCPVDYDGPQPTLKRCDGRCRLPDASALLARLGAAPTGKGA